MGVGPVALSVQSVGAAVPPKLFSTSLISVNRAATGNGTSSVHSGLVEPSGQFGPGDVTVAEFTTFPFGSMPAGGNGSAANVTISIVDVAPAARVPRLHVTVCPTAVHGGVDETNERPVGNWSVT